MQSYPVVYLLTNLESNVSYIYDVSNKPDDEYCIIFEKSYVYEILLSRLVNR